MGIVSFVIVVSVVILGNVVPIGKDLTIVAKYTPEFLNQVLSADEFDVLTPEFIARAAGKVAGAGATVHDCQVETLRVNTEIFEKLDAHQLPADDRWRLICLDGAEMTVKAQGRMWSALGDIGESLAKVVRRA